MLVVFRVPASLSGMTTGEFGRISFVFETLCSADCELYFMMVCLWFRGTAVNIYSQLTVVAPPAGREQEEHHGGGVLGGQQRQTVVHTQPDQERLCHLHMGLSEDQPRCGREWKHKNIHQ